MLGDLIARFSEDSEVETAIQALDDLSLLVALRELAEARELSLGVLATEKVRRCAVGQRQPGAAYPTERMKAPTT